MASTDCPLASPDGRGIRRLLRLRTQSVSSADQNPLISSSLHPPPASSAGVKKKAFSSAAFRNLGCSSAASQVYAPSSAAAAVRSSADWEVKVPRRRRIQQKKKERRGHLSSSGSADAWCTPGISFVGNDSVDCVVSHRDMMGRERRNDGERSLRERPYYGRRGGNQVPASSMAHSLFSLQASLSGSGLLPSDHYHHVRGYNHHHHPDELDEIMLLQHRILLRGGDAFDRYRDWRLDVDQMTYEELLELGDKIGHVSTGLREEEFECSIRRVKYSIFDRRFSSELERKCSICQEEYETADEVGKLGCGHSYHIYCIRKWLLQKNACPVCKTSVRKF